MPIGSLILTSINPPTKGVQAFAALRERVNLIVVADKKTPSNWACTGARLLTVTEQQELRFAYAKCCPYNTYARKNLGYLMAWQENAPFIIESDDDNVPYSTFATSVTPQVEARKLTARGWVNVYGLFGRADIWPRGLPLTQILAPPPDAKVETQVHESLVQQYLADGDPDVDAIYRLTRPYEYVRFEGAPVSLGPGTYCTFNSQNTLWWPAAYPLLYLPCFVSFRMTDIWRSLVAQVCLHACGYPVTFHSSTVYQERNPHSLLRDFEQEIPGYLHNDSLMRVLLNLSLSSDVSDLTSSLRQCYDALIRSGYVPAQEAACVDAWCADASVCQASAPNVH